MSAEPTRPDGAPELEDADRSGQGASGEGAGSALEAMLKKRQMRVDPPPDSSVPPRVQPQDDGEADKKAEE